MTSITTLEKFVTAAKDQIGESFYSDTWRSTSYLIQLLVKMESYFESLNADDPESDYFTAQIAASSALNLISNSYNCPVSDDRFELVKDAYDATVNLFITEFSDEIGSGFWIAHESESICFGHLDRVTRPNVI